MWSVASSYYEVYSHTTILCITTCTCTCVHPSRPPQYSYSFYMPFLTIVTGLDETSIALPECVPAILVPGRPLTCTLCALGVSVWDLLYNYAIFFPCFMSDSRLWTGPGGWSVVHDDTVRSDTLLSSAWSDSRNEVQAEWYVEWTNSFFVGEWRSKTIIILLCRYSTLYMYMYG